MGTSLCEKQIIGHFIVHNRLLILECFTDGQKRYKAEIPKIMDTTFCHVSKMIDEMVEANLLERVLVKSKKGEKNNKLKYYQMTQKGENVYNILKNLIMLVDSNEN
jgi:DNA-binding HxlR family transcriptional regulator